MRKLEEVIDQMLMVIPGDQDHLRATLVSHRSSALFASPELVQLRWRETAMELEDIVQRIVMSSSGSLYPNAVVNFLVSG